MSGLPLPLSSYPVMQSPAGVVSLASSGNPMLGEFGVVLASFLLVALVAWVIIYTVRPQFIKNDDGSINYGTLLLWSVIFAVIVVVLLWMVRAASQRKY